MRFKIERIARKMLNKIKRLKGFELIKKKNKKSLLWDFFLQFSHMIDDPIMMMENSMDIQHSIGMS